MTLIPAFEIGIWNVWILMLCHTLLYMSLMVVAREQTKQMESSQVDVARWLYPVITILWIATVIYSIFVPLQLGTLWFYIGLPLFILGFLGQALVSVSVYFTRISDEPITVGIYKYSRHPYYVTQLVLFIGVGVSSASWILLLIAIIYSYLHFIMASSEETICLEKYGDTYREYMVKTPKWAGIPKHL